MNVKTILMIYLCLLLPSCANIPSPPSQETHSLAIQAYSESSIITTAIKELTSKINGIIKKELGLDQEYEFAFFIPKKRQRITLYYINDINQNNESMLLSALENMGIMHMKPTNVNATSNTQFFGDQQEELVFMIDDQKGELLGLNQKIKAMAHQLNDTYKEQHDHDLYNVAKSERHPFTPHMGLGRIRLQSIKNNIKDASQINGILGRIRTEIKKVTSEVLEKIVSKGDPQIFFNTFGVLDLQKQIYIKEW